MKNSKLLLMLFLALSFSFVACEDDGDDEPAVVTNTSESTNLSTIAEIAIADDRTDSLVVALTKAELVNLFSNPGNFTVFAPTNQAFVDLLATDASWNNINDIDKDVLTSVLQYHVLGSEVRSGDLTEDSYANTLNTSAPNNESLVIEVDLMPSARINNSAMISAPNIEASNGVIHIIEAVLDPRAQNTVNLAINDERFSTLVSALQVFGDTLTDALNGLTSSTIFAPTNDAFQALLDSDTTWNSLNDIPRNLLRTVLTYHVVNGLNVQSKDLNEGSNPVTALNLEPLVVKRNGASVTVETGNMAQADVNVIVANVQGTNGVIHAVDAVLLP